MRDLIAALLQGVCVNVTTGPWLQRFTGEIFPPSAITDDKARLHVCAKGFWGIEHPDAFFDLRIFYPFTSSYRQSKLSSVYRQHETNKNAQSTDKE